jgi:rSAM/selenodomain-associated transferase 1
VLVFSRLPRMGRVKTRLVPRLGEWGAARLHARLTVHALRTARAARCGPVELHLTARRRGAKLQRGVDLGERMHRALAAALRRHRGALLIGADCPALRGEDLRRAARLLLGGCDMVLAPAEDGGYVLVGARRIPPGVFSGIDWGSASVYDETVRRLAGRRWRALGTLWDLDRPEDLDRFRSLRWPSMRRPRAPQ